MQPLGTMCVRRVCHGAVQGQGCSCACNGSMLLISMSPCSMQQASSSCNLDAALQLTLALLILHDMQGSSIVQPHATADQASVQDDCQGSI